MTTPPGPADAPGSATTGAGSATPEPATGPASAPHADLQGGAAWTSPGGQPQYPAPRAHAVATPAATPAASAAADPYASMPATGPTPRVPRGPGLAITALVLGLSGAVIATIPYLCFGAIPLLIAGAVCGIVAGSRPSRWRTEALLGLGASGLALVITVLVAVVTFQTLGSAQRGFEASGGWEALGEELGDPSDPLSGPLFTPDRVEFGGSGSETVAVSPADGAGDYGYAHITSESAEPFRVTGLDADGEELEYIVDVYGPYDGYVLWNAVPGDEVESWKIEASDGWTVSIRGMNEVPTIEDGSVQDGWNDAVYLYEGGTTDATLVSAEDSPVWLWSTSGPSEGLCAQFEGSLCEGRLKGGAFGTYLQVYADFEWTLALGQPAGSTGAV